MSYLVEHKDCIGCSSCMNACAFHAISMANDDNGFLYPYIDNKKCVNCHRCEQVCPIHNTKESIYDNKAYVAYIKDENIRINSSSGGAFSAIASYLFDTYNDVIVFGSTLDSNLNVKHISVCSKDELYKLRSSKYVQSDMGNTYKEARELLDNSKIVLFTGTPCQIAGLHSFLNKDYDNLYTIDLICHGVPSKKVFDKYIKSKEKNNNSKVKSISFRNKKSGWTNYSIALEYVNGKEELTPFNRDDYMKLFLSNYSLRESCYDCKFKGKNHQADITLGDLWGSESINNIANDDIGLSLVITNSIKGEIIIDKLNDYMTIKNIDLLDGTKSNTAYSQSVRKPLLRESFFKDLEKYDFGKVTNIYCSNENKYVKIRQLKEDYLSVKEEKGEMFARLWCIKKRIIDFFT